MNIATIKIDDLTLDPKNARKHDDQNIKAIAGSLATFGQRKPIVVWRNTVVAGNGTLVAARSLGWKEIQVALIPDDWQADKVQAFALADNRTAELAVWDEQVLAAQLIELGEGGWEVAEFGFATVDTASDEQLEDAFADLGREKGDLEQITFTLHMDQASTIRQAIEQAHELGEYGDTGNTNKNGNAITRIVELWLGQNVG
jgi:ParB-like chromosome segregation protein Spo0J